VVRCRVLICCSQIRTTCSPRTSWRAITSVWQIWIQTGAQPIPRSKTLAGAPQYTLPIKEWKIKEWKTDAISDAETFTFKPPEGATKASLNSDVMIEFDEVPPGTAAGAKK
jgi:hypothetical protein